jgi:NitT/TauT family transport system permease protein
VNLPAAPVAPAEPAARLSPVLGDGTVSALSRLVRLRRRRLPSLGRLAVRGAALLAAGLAWHLAATHKLNLKLIDFANVPPPAEVLRAAGELFASPKVGAHIGNSLLRVFAGFAAAAVVGVGLGLLVGRSRRAEDLLMPPLEVLRPIPGVAWIPLAILMFPLAEVSMVFITFIGALFLILLSTIHGVEVLDRRLVVSARCLGAGRWHVFRDIVLPGALPHIVTGLSIGMGTAWFCLVTAEMIAGQFGIGYYTWEAYNLQRYADIVVGMLTIGGFGLASSALVRRLGGALTPWYQPERKADAARP